MLDGTLFFVKSAEYRNRGKDVFPDFVLYIVLICRQFFIHTLIRAPIE